MSTKMLRILTICFTIAVMLNVANITYCIYNNRCDINLMEYRFDQDIIVETEHWNNLRTMLICDHNSTDCANLISYSASSTETTENGLNNYVIGVQSNLYELCPKVPLGLGPVKYDGSIIQLSGIDDIYVLKPGGVYRPPHCIPRQSVAIIIPMQCVNRAWKNYIGTFLYYIHPFLMKQLSEYQVFVIVQGEPSEPFARGKLLNVGFLEAQRMKKSGWSCLIFHDAYLIPTDTRNMYRCGKWPRQLVANHRKLKKFGGAVSIKPRIFKNINGFSNLDWHNDEDYVNMFKRLKAWNYTIQTNRPLIGKYTSLQVIPNHNISRYDTSHATTPIHLIDGLVSLEYKVVDIKFQRLYTRIQVDLHTIE